MAGPAAGAPAFWETLSGLIVGLVTVYIYTHDYDSTVSQAAILGLFAFLAGTLFPLLGIFVPFAYMVKLWAVA